MRSKIFLRLYFKISLLIIFFPFINAQEKYLSPDDVKAEWQNYTKFQREELVNFATFLYNEGFYERALLSYFQYLYKYPNDELEIATYFQIGKCYESMENWDLAKNYYNRILDEPSSNKVERKAAKYPTIETTSSLSEVLASQYINAVAIATPAEQHYSMAKKSLLAGCNIVLYCAGNIKDNYKLIKSMP